jgi:hypothetical protein
MRILLVFVLLIGILFGACASQATEDSVNKEASGYLRLTGSFERREILIDGANVGVDPEEDTMRISLKPGSHLLEIRSSNRILLSQQIEIVPGQTLQITAP